MCLHRNRDRGCCSILAKQIAHTHTSDVAHHGDGCRQESFRIILELLHRSGLDETGGCDQHGQGASVVEPAADISQESGQATQARQGAA